MLKKSSYIFSEKRRRSTEASGNGEALREDELAKVLFKLKLGGPRLQKTIDSLRLHSVTLESLRAGEVSDDSLKKMDIPTGVRMKLLRLRAKKVSIDY